MKRILLSIILMLMYSFTFSQITLLVNQQNVSCFGLTDASATVTANGGTPAYSYTWMPGGQTSSVATGLTAGQYTVYVEDASAVMNSLVVTITEPTQLNSVTIANNVKCFGAATGTVSIAGTGGVSPYTYLWTTIPSSLATIANVPAGNYSVIVTDANGCVISNSVSVSQPAQLTASSTLTAAACSGVCNGAFNILPSGGSAPYTFTTSTGSTSNYNTNQCAGNYTVTITDANNCFFAYAVTVPSIGGPTVSISSQANVSCFGQCDGSAATSVSGGTTPYMYSWSSGQVTPTVTNLCSGVYTATVTDINGCTGTESVNITQPTQLIINAIQTPVLCFGTSTGTISTLAMGGTPAYVYSLNASMYQSSGIFSNLATGIYMLDTKDANGCIASTTVQVTEPPLLTSTITSQVNAPCNSYPGGSASVLVLGGVGAYNYSWSPGGQTTATASGLFAGTYSVNITDGNFCTTTSTVTITQPSSYVNASITQTNVTTCYGMCNGAIQINNVTGGVAPYTYYYNSSSPQSSLLFTSICAGIYTVYVKDANNCQYMLGASITQPANLTTVISSTNTTCGQNNGSLCASINGGTPPLSSMWSNAVNTLCNNSLPGGVYTFTVTDNNGCSAIASKTISSNSGLIISIASQTNVSCFGGSDGGASISITGGTAPFTYSWTPGVASATSLVGVPTGIYSVTVTDAGGCAGTQSIVIIQPSQLLIYTNSQSECIGMCNGSLNANPFGGVSPYQYNWSTGINTSYLNGLCSGSYSVQVTDLMGCVATQTAVVNSVATVSVTAVTTNASCGGICDGQAIASTVGISGITYSWVPSGQSSYRASNLCAGNYTLYATDMNGCASTDTFVISNIGVTTMTNAILSTVATKETCFQSFDGSIDLTITGSNPGPFTYHWSNGANTQDAFNLNSNIYSVTVFDASLNCLAINDTITAAGTNCGIIKGNVFVDNNADCIKNSGDVNCNSALVVANPGNRYGYVNMVGDYTINNLPLGSYSVSLLYGWGTLIPTPSCSTTIYTSVNSGTMISNNNNFSFGYNSITQPDMQVWGYSSTIVPGFVAHLTYNLSNSNNVSGTGLFKAVLPSAYSSNITLVSPTTYTLSGDTVIWDFNNITFSGGSTYFSVDLYVPVNAPLGSTFNTCMFAEPNTTDLNYSNNTYCYSTIITGSFDPNDKTVSPAGIGSNGDIATTETDLTYLIRFQNTGNGPAVNVIVKDTLSPNVDINTFEMLSSSHNYNIDILPGNVLRWRFTSIMLPDSNTNEPASHGYIQYRIKRNSNNTPGTQIKNTAYIYFDFNAPVVTNTAINTIETVTGIHSFSNASELSVYPNPNNGIMQFNYSITKKAELVITDITGRVVNTYVLDEAQRSIPVKEQELNAGVYFYSVRQNDKILKQDKIIVIK